MRLPLLALGALAILAVVVLAPGGEGSPARRRPVRRILVARRGRSLPAPIAGEATVAAKGGPLILGGLIPPKPRSTVSSGSTPGPGA